MCKTGVLWKNGSAKGTNNWLNVNGVMVLDWPMNWSDLNPIENIWSIVNSEMEGIRPNNADHLRPTIKAPRASITPQQNHRLTAFMSHSK